jgi:hypothetical protein
MTNKISNVTDLDFFTIKENLISHFKQSNSPFKDWDFAGSGLNYLLDVLAYNTHYNAVNAHVAMNETFLDSAQLRSNVVSRAKILGYTPRSNSGAKAIVDITFTRSGGSTVESLILPRGTTFSATIDGDTYTFTTLSEYTSAYVSGTNTFTFTAVEISEGEMETQQFVVNSAVLKQIYKIPDKNIDTSTLRVKVYEHANSTEYDTFLDSSNFVSYDADSNVYFLSEDYDGYYQLEFGDGVIGKQLDNLQIIEIEYLSTNDSPSDANSISTFEFGTAGDENFSIVIADVDSVNTIEVAAGGESRETIESIRKTAPLSFMAQNRAVTTTDYEGLIRKTISGLDAISVWGGQESVPPQYGKVFVAVKPTDALFLTNSQKAEIETYLDTIKIMTVKPEVVDPTYLYLYFDVIFKYNPSLTTLNKSELEGQVKSTLETYNDETLGSFEQIFRYSNFLSLIDDTNTAITNSYARIYCYKTLDLKAIGASPAIVDFKFELLGDPDQDESIIESTSWEYNGTELFLKDEPIIGSDERRVYAYTVGTSGKQTKIFFDVGRLDIETGILTLNALPTSSDTSIQIRTVPDSYDIKTIREQLLTIDFSKCNIIGEKETSRASYNSTSLFRN